MTNRWLVTVDNLEDQTFDEFLDEFVHGTEDDYVGIGLDYTDMSPATTAILESDASSKKIKAFVRDKLDPSEGRATITKISGSEKYIGKVWDIDMSVDENWAAH